jgi:hypothetical protein
LNAVAERLDFAVCDRALLGVEGWRRGLLVRYRYAARHVPGGGDDARLCWTELSVEITPARLLLELRPQTVRELRLVHDGEAVDLILGDAAFDRAYVVEGAPEVVVRELLDAALRARLVAAAPLLVRCDGPEITVARPDWFIEPEEALTLLELALDLAEAVPAAARRAQRAGELSGDPYRSVPNDAAARAARIEELAALVTLRGRRG